MPAVITGRIRITHEVEIPDDRGTTLSFDTVVDNTGGVADLTNRPTSLVAPQPGLYLV
ncbi:hypothetical protein [Streptomyces sp. DSM 118148]|uniref:hypothetical protein n=1 Tax=Streptomyces sp. DSM 118148 TaxID=3448667 RepID=UPI0040402AB8